MEAELVASALVKVDSEVTSPDKLGTSLGYLVGPRQHPAAMARDGANVSQQEALDLHPIQAGHGQRRRRHVTCTSHGLVV